VEKEIKKEQIDPPTINVGDILKITFDDFQDYCLVTSCKESQDDDAEELYGLHTLDGMEVANNYSSLEELSTYLVTELIPVSIEVFPQKEYQLGLKKIDRT